jgi:DNA polymerase V
MQYKISHQLRFLRPEFGPPLTLALFHGGIRAGFPSPAADFEEEQLNLIDLIPSPETTFFAWCEGTSMIGLGLAPN